MCATTATKKTGLFSPRAVVPVILVFGVLVFWLARSHHSSFDWHSLAHQLRAVSIPELAGAVAFGYLGYGLRAWRWAVLLRPIHKTTTLEMLPSQLIGFTIAGLFGRFADLARPYLIARRTRTSVATQLAIYSIERAFDLASAAILFSITLAFAPHDMPHHEAFARAGIVSLAATLLLTAFALALRFASEGIAGLTARLLQPLSAKLATSVAERIREFSHGLRILSSIGEFLYALGLSLVIWIFIAMVYFESAHAFRASAPLAKLGFAATMLLLATSMGGSLLQLPVVGWFTQIALIAAALHGFFGASLETATACATVILLVTNIIVSPAGLVAARVEGVNLREAAKTPAEG